MSSLRNNAILSLRNFAAGFFSLPTVSSLEGFFLRLLFGIVVSLDSLFAGAFSRSTPPGGSGALL